MWVAESHPQDEAKAPPASPFASVAQLVEQGTENPRVAGSIPAGGTTVPVGYRMVSTGGSCKIQAYAIRSFHRMEADAGVAHLVERHLAKVEVASSSLVTRSKKKGLPIGSHFFLGFSRQRRLSPFGLKCSAEVNSACAEVLPAAKRSYGIKRLPTVWGPALVRHLISWYFFLGRLPTGAVIFTPISCQRVKMEVY